LKRFMMLRRLDLVDRHRRSRRLEVEQAAQRAELLRLVVDSFGVGLKVS
jgi:hypothetical protein